MDYLLFSCSHLFPCTISTLYFFWFRMKSSLPGSNLEFVIQVNQINKRVFLDLTTYWNSQTRLSMCCYSKHPNSLSSIKLSIRSYFSWNSLGLNVSISRVNIYGKWFPDHFAVDRQIGNVFQLPNQFCILNFIYVAPHSPKNIIH